MLYIFLGEEGRKGATFKNQNKIVTPMAFPLNNDAPEESRPKPHEDRKALVWTIHHYDVVDSTNSMAKKMASEGTVVVAARQEDGKGRLDRKWLSPEGGLWFSVVLRPAINPAEASMVTLMAGVAVSEALREYGVNTEIKWPNDILIGGKKVCGILTEMRTGNGKVDFVVLGIGINVNLDIEELPEPVRESATSLKAETGRELDREVLLQNLLAGIGSTYEILRSGKKHEILEQWRKRSSTLGRSVRIETLKETVEGMALDVDDDGVLILETKDGNRCRFLAGDCIHLTANK
jgi:BirA family biotin operon repressor/biotin-[acetyl-CoA-carboxylase] ligase